MTNLTKEQRENVMLEGKRIMDNLSEGKSARDVMAQMYVDNLDDKTLTQGYAIADAIIERVKIFDSDYHEAQNNIDKYLKRFQSSIDKDKTPAERCTYWLRFTATITASCMIDNGDNVDEAIDPNLAAEHIVQMSVSEEEATPEYERELHEKAIEAIKNSGVMLSGLMEHADEIKEMDDSIEAGAFIVDMGAQEIDYRAVVSMLVYTRAKSGVFDNIPADMTLDQITTLVCAEIEQIKIMNEVGTNNMAEEVATLLLQILGTIVIVSVFAPLMMVGVAVAVEMFSIIFAIPALLLVVFGVYHLTSAAISAWIEDSGKIVKTTSCAVKALIKGAIVVSSYVYKNVFKKVLAVSKNWFVSVKRKENNESVRDNRYEAEHILAQ